MPEELVIVEADSMLSLCVDVLMEAGLGRESATVAADVLVRSSLRGVDTHGVNALGLYAEHLREGGANPSASLVSTVDRGPLVITDGQAGLGPVVASHATRLAISRAKQYGIATVTVKNANHFGAAGYFALMCAEAGCMGLIVSNTPPIMAVTGSRSRSIGNSPLGFGAPRRGGPPFILDLALSRVAGGKVRLALARKRGVPLGWILDPEGNPTTDPADFFDRHGALLPLGEHKGYGLALMIETLAGVLSGASMLSQINNFLYSPELPGGIGYFLHVIDVSDSEAFPGFEDRMKALCDEITSALLAPGVDRIVIPGEVAAEREADARVRGKVMPVADWRRLFAIASLSGCPPPSAKPFFLTD